MHVIERTERFTLIGADARRGKLTLFEADGPREPGVLGRIGLRVSSLAGRDAVVDLGEGIQVVLVEGETDVDFDLDHIGLVSPDPAAAAAAWEAFGFSASGRRRSRSAARSSSCSRAIQGRPSGRSSTTSASSSTRSRSTSPAPRSAASRSTTWSTRRTRWRVFVWGPDRVKLEYVEHKPSFSLS